MLVAGSQPLGLLAQSMPGLVAVGEPGSELGSLPAVAPVSVKL